MNENNKCSTCKLRERHVEVLRQHLTRLRWARHDISVFAQHDHGFQGYFLEGTPREEIDDKIREIRCIMQVYYRYRAELC
jgi:hypothetical protein